MTFHIPQVAFDSESPLRFVEIGPPHCEGFVELAVHKLDRPVVTVAA